MSYFQRVQLLREFNRYSREIRRENPAWPEDVVRAAALDSMKAVHGDSPDWKNILQMLLQFLMTILPFFFLAEENDE